MAMVCDVLVHRDEPLRSIAIDDRLLRTPRMGVLMFQTPACDEVAGLGQRLDHRVVGIALLALVVEYALALETRRLRGERAVFINGIRDRRVDTAFLKIACGRNPGLEVFPAVARRGVDEAGAGV